MNARRVSPTPCEPGHVSGVYRCRPPLMSAAHTSPTLSLTLQIGLVKWDPGFTDFDEKINASFICFEQGVKTGKLEKKVDRLSLSGVTRTLALAFSRQRVPLNNNPKPPIV